MSCKSCLNNRFLGANGRYYIQYLGLTCKETETIISYYFQITYILYFLHIYSHEGLCETKWLHVCCNVSFYDAQLWWRTAKYKFLRLHLSLFMVRLNYHLTYILCNIYLPTMIYLHNIDMIGFYL